MSIVFRKSDSRCRSRCFATKPGRWGEPYGTKDGGDETNERIPLIRAAEERVTLGREGQPNREVPTQGLCGDWLRPRGTTREKIPNHCVRDVPVAFITICALAWC